MKDEKKVVALSQTCMTAANVATTMSLYIPHWKKLMSFTPKRKNSLRRLMPYWRNRR